MFVIITSATMSNCVVFFLSASYISELVGIPYISARKHEAFTFFYSDICYPLAFVYKIKHNCVCWVEQVEIYCFFSLNLSGFSGDFWIKKKYLNISWLVRSDYSAHQITQWLKANDCFWDWWLLTLYRLELSINGWCACIDILDVISPLE